MKKLFIIIGIISLLFLAVGCATTSSTVVSGEPKAVVVIGLDGIPQPDWVVKTVAAQDMHYETGYAKMSDKQTSIKRATVEAKKQDS